MAGPKGHSCPECGAPKGPRNAPSCGCAQRASEALRDTRTAEAAAAEDFDPLRIRPYVDLDAPADSTMPLRLTEAASAPVPPRAGQPPREPGRPEESDGPEDRLDRPGAVDGGEEPVRRRRTVLLAGAAALVALVAAAGFASGLLSHATPSRDGAAPEEVREKVPDVSSSAPVRPSPATASASARTSAPATPSRSASPSSSPSAPASSTPTRSPGPSRSAEPTETVTAAHAPVPASASPSPVLRPGDRGAEVTELQLRLRQLGLYAGKIDGDYTAQVQTSVSTYQWTRGIQADEPGVYDAPTRAKLESETSQP
ncbi:peptidoglycan-binding protein [Streptomyces sp. NPDC001544]|uniref:peptidoglycan-binding domain-containing protein n=1 Tax=Streptomyces sp. NPDC001544 TaxID=3364584 RepID=UPI0036885509